MAEQTNTEQSVTPAPYSREAGGPTRRVVVVPEPGWSCSMCGQDYWPWVPECRKCKAATRS